MILVVFGVQAAYAGRMYPGVRALGVGVGGQSRDDARAMLERRAAEMANRSITIGYQEQRWTVAGQHLGVRTDVSPVLEEAYGLGRQGNPFSRLFLQFGLLINGPAYEVRAPAYERSTLDAFMQALAGAVDRPVQDARLAIRPEGRADFTEAQTGRLLQVDATRRRLEEALAHPEVIYVDLVVEETAPRVTSSDLAPTRAKAEALLSGPIALKFQDSEWQLSTQQLAAMAVVDSERGVALNREAVSTWASQLAEQVNGQPQNARFTWSGGNLSLLRPGKDGRELNVSQMVELVIARALGPERSITLPVGVTRPEVATEDGAKLNIKGSIEISRTSFAGASPPKRHNIGLATERLNGTVVPPGKLFSFNREVGSTSLDNGYRLGWGIANAGTSVRTVPSVAGGICQVATTLFHTVFWAGYQLEERNYHLYWIPGYTSKGVEGLDATVDEEGGLDLQFYNNTEDYLLIQSWVEGSSVVFGLYGNKPDWVVKVTPGERTDVVDASKDQIVEDEPTLPLGQRLAVEGAQDGFKMAVVRTVTRGSDVRTLRLSSTYRPSRNVTLVGTGGRPAGPSQVVRNEATRGADSTPTPRASVTPGPMPTAAAPAVGTPVRNPTNTPAPALPGPAQPTATPPAPSKPLFQPAQLPAPATPTRAPAAATPSRR